MEKVVPRHISRRRMITISASFAGAAMAGAHSTLVRAKTGRSGKLVTWKGIALGARAQISLVHFDAIEACEVLDRCRSEISRLEALFSLYQPQSALCELNRNGKLIGPAPEMVELISRSVALGEETDGAFDISVQPLWELYANHFKSSSAQQSGPPAWELEDAMALVDYRQIVVASDGIGFKRAGMGVTLNGIAQGYVTDKVSSLLRGAGFTNVLVHLGETYGMGLKSAGKPWVAAIQDPVSASGFVKSVALSNRALATSGSYGTTFSADGTHHHLFDPRTGRSTNRYRSVSVVAPDALSADALSTAFSSMDLKQIEQLLLRRANVRAVIVQANNDILEL